MFTWRPIDHYPGVETRSRQHSPFRAKYSDTETLLYRELRQLPARNVVIMVTGSERDFRNDGAMRANATPKDPRVVVAFEGRVNGEWIPLKYACDRFYKWQDNLRAIALGLEALRKVERYGIANRGEQYTGWKALGSGMALGARKPMSREDAERIVADLADIDPVELHHASLTDVIRTALKRHHPDQGGTPEAIAALLEARAVLLGE